MGVSINTRQAYSEVDEFLGLISNEHRNKIPKKLREFFREEKDTNYIKGINPNVPIKNQKLKEETLGIIALLNLQYWCEDENEKKRLKEVNLNISIEDMEEKEGTEIITQQLPKAGIKVKEGVAIIAYN